MQESSPEDKPMISINQLKPLVGIDPEDSTKDLLLQFTLDDVEQIILNYCNLDVLPMELEHTAYRMAMDLYRGENIGEEGSGMKVSSISEGSTSTSFSDTSETLKDTLLKDYQAQLNRYRKLRW